MILQTAKCHLLHDRMDWTRPHLRWVPAALYARIIPMRDAAA